MAFGDEPRCFPQGICLIAEFLERGFRRGNQHRETLPRTIDAKHIVIMRNEGGRTVMHLFNYNDAAKSKGVKANIELKPGDTIVVP